MREKNQEKKRVKERAPKGLCRALGLLLALLILLPLFACSLGGQEEEEGIARYGEEGARFARKLAQLCPRRTPYSIQEEKAASFIIDELKSYGYEPEVQTFTVTDQEGIRQSSANIIARLEGQGFTVSSKLTDEEKNKLPQRRDDLLMVVGAHYDTPVPMTEEEEGELTEEAEGPRQLPDGIHNNASGVAAVLTAARIMRQERPGYEVIFVFFGAGTDQYQGARHYLATLSSQERQRIDVMVNIGPIYAGDKVYAHAGQNSVKSGDYKDYAKRRKLYQMTDIFFDYKLNSRNKYAIYTNQASFFVDLDQGGRAVFREWTTKLSDHTPFDRAGIPVIFMESGDYRIKKLEEVRIESRNPFFQETGGIISGTPFDRTGVLEELFHQMDEQTARQTLPVIDHDDPDDWPDPTETEKDEPPAVVPRLTLRINNTAFVLVQLARKGPLNYDFDE